MMLKKSATATWVVVRVLVIGALVACARGENMYDVDMGPVATPTVDYVESLDVYSAPHMDSFLNQLAMNYRSYAIYNARTSGYADIGELFANKAVAAFSGDLPYPETLDYWTIDDENAQFALNAAYNDLIEQLKNDASYTNPELAAEAQAKFDCWLSATASGQMATAAQCQDRFNKALVALRDCKNGRVVKTSVSEKTVVDMGNTTIETEAQTFYPETRDMVAMNSGGSPREGVIIVTNVNVPEHLINPVPVQPMVFNQNIYGGDKTITKDNGNKLLAVQCNSESADCSSAPVAEPVMEPVAEPIPMIGDELVSREEFINMMMAMRSELAAINARLDEIQATAGEKTMIKVQQIPLEPTQHVMEEVLEIRFDFNKATIKPEYQELIKDLASATQENKNIKVSVVGHTDTTGTSNYNYALGGRRADAVQKMLIQYGIPASQIVAVSAGEQDLAVQTPDNTPDAANRRVRVVKEVHYTEDPKPIPMEIAVEEYSVDACGEYGCEE